MDFGARETILTSHNHATKHMKHSSKNCFSTIYNLAIEKLKLCLVRLSLFRKMFLLSYKYTPFQGDAGCVREWKYIMDMFIYLGNI